jgi:hypothetical protein
MTKMQKVQIGDRRTTTEPLAATNGTIIPAGASVEVTGREQRGWSVQVDDGRVAEWVASIQLGVDVVGDSPANLSIRLIRG